MNSLVNKGRCFVQCIEQDPEGVQAGPLIEQLMDETLGKGWICHSFLSNGADPGGYPQGLHIDQAPLLPFQTQEAPVLFNTMYIPQDINEENGGTLLIPGSHQIMAEAGSGGEVGELPPAINLEARAGTLVIFDGRLLHGTGANRTDRQRFVATMSNVTAWTRQQENWIMTVRPRCWPKRARNCCTEWACRHSPMAAPSRALASAPRVGWATPSGASRSFARPTTAVSTCAWANYPPNLRRKRSSAITP